jgi:DNA relaxase NicK
MNRIDNNFRIEYNGGGCFVCFVDRENLHSKLVELGSRVQRFDLVNDYIAYLKKK